MGTAICGRCGAWVNDRAWRCRSCGRLIPGVFGQRRLLDRVFDSARSQTRVLLVALVVLYVFELFLSSVTGFGGRNGQMRFDPTTIGEVRAGALLPWPAEHAHVLLEEGLGVRGANALGKSTSEQPWRLVSAMLLHGGVLHIVFNGLSLLSLGMFVESVFGPARFWTIFTLTGVAGNVGMLWFSGDYVLGLGASGGIFGLFGAILGWSVRRGGTVGYEVRRQLLRALVLNVVISLLPGISFAAHACGLVSGFLMTWLLRIPDVRSGRESDRARFAGLASMLVLVGSVVLAFVSAARWVR
jgi:membrane associated rhomboid family serine protease